MRRIICVFILTAFCVAGFTQSAGWAKNQEQKGHGNAAKAQTKDNPGKDNPGKDDKIKNSGNGHDVDKADQVMAGIIIGAGITVAEAHSLALTEKLTGAAPLPPGIQKNLLRGKPLPPGIAKKTVSGNLLGKLPAHPGYEWRMAGADLLLVHVATGLLADVLVGVFK